MQMSVSDKSLTTWNYYMKKNFKTKRTKNKLHAARDGMDEAVL